MGLVGLIWWLTILLQCFDTVGWVTWPVKISSPNDLYCVEWDVKPYSTQLKHGICAADVKCLLKIIEYLLPIWRLFSILCFDDSKMYLLCACKTIILVILTGVVSFWVVHNRQLTETPSCVQGLYHKECLCKIGKSLMSLCLCPKSGTKALANKTIHGGHLSSPTAITTELTLAVYKD